MQKEIKEAKFQYGYSNRIDIEKCEDNHFKILKSKDNTSYILYGNKLYQAIFEEVQRNVIFQKSVWQEEEKAKIINSCETEEYFVDKIYKLHTGLKLNSFGFIKKNEIKILNTGLGNYINPEIEIIDNKAIINEDEIIIGKVHDSRSITLLKAINKGKDIVYVNENVLNIFTLKDINRVYKDDEDFKEDNKFIITIFEDEKHYKNRLRSISNGCRIKDEIWLFYIRNNNGTTEEEVILHLPENRYCYCVLSGNELKVKKFINKPPKGKGICSLIIRDVTDVEFRRKDALSEENRKESDGFNEFSSNNQSVSEFSRMINRYKNLEAEILDETKNKCRDLAYVSLEKDLFRIQDNSIETLKNWQGKEGANICFKGKKDVALGAISEIGENFIRVDFQNDMVSSSIPRKKGKIGISLVGDEVIQKRRNNAIKILENNSSALPNLNDILSGNYKLKEFSYKSLLKKYEYDRFVGKQIDAVDGVMNTPDIFLIQGPPGTGKTTVIRKIVEKVLEAKEEVLITSYQNLAVDNVLEGFNTGKVIQYRFGTEDNKAMYKICSDVAEDIKRCLKNNISSEREEEIEKIKSTLEKSTGRILEESSLTELIQKIKEILEEINAYEGKSSNYIKIEEIMLQIQNEKNENNINFDRNTIYNMLPKNFGYDLEIIEQFEATENYLKEVNKTLNNLTINKVILKLKELQDLDCIFTLDNKEYQKIKQWILDELKLVKVDCKTNERDYFEEKLEIGAILDNIIENMPEYVEDDKYKVIKEFHEKISNNPGLIEEVFKKFADIRGTTCQKTASKLFLESTHDINYKYVIVDEAARANPLDLLIPIIKGEKVILVGDHMQLPHMLENYVEENFKQDEGFNIELFNKYIKESLFGRLFNELPNDRKIMLDTQYRMTKEIGELVSELFYDSKLKTGTDIVNDTPLYTGNALVSINIKGKQQETKSGSFTNQNEQKEIIKKLKELDELSKELENKPSVGVITFYKSQANSIESKVRELGLKIDVTVGTVDAYQGLEKDIIFISAVRTDGIGFVGNPNRLNVALSRAKKLVVIFGDKKNLKENELFRKILDRCIDGEENKCI